jgi:hypothetical protein
MPYPQSYNFHNAKVPMTLYEGAFSESADYVLGGKFANEMKDGDYVKLVATDSFAVTKVAPGETAIGFLDGSPRGLGKTNGRQGDVQLFGIRVLGLPLDTASAAIAPYDKLVCAGGKWLKTTGSSDVIALGKSAASGSIADGDVIPALLGKFNTE